MATIRKEIQIDAPFAKAWDALRDVGALHSKLVPGFVTNTEMDGNARIVTFGNGMTAREDIVSIDDARHRVCWAILDQKFRHYNGAAQVLADGAGCRFVWTTDVLPDELAPAVEQMMSAGIATIRKTLEAG
jgi:hypothetical protein